MNFVLSRPLITRLNRWNEGSGFDVGGTSCAGARASGVKSGSACVSKPRGKGRDRANITRL